MGTLDWMIVVLGFGLGYGIYRVEIGLTRIEGLRKQQAK